MEDVKPYNKALGIDVSAARLDWHRLPDGSCGNGPNSAEGIQTLIAELEQSDVDIVVIEATGGLQRALATALVAAGIAVAVVNPRRGCQEFCVRAG